MDTQKIDQNFANESSSAGTGLEPNVERDQNPNDSGAAGETDVSNSGD